MDVYAGETRSKLTTVYMGQLKHTDFSKVHGVARGEEEKMKEPVAKYLAPIPLFSAHATTESSPPSRTVGNRRGVGSDPADRRRPYSGPRTLVDKLQTSRQLNPFSPSLAQLPANLPYK